MTIPKAWNPERAAVFGSFAMLVILQPDAAQAKYRKPRHFSSAEEANLPRGGTSAHSE
jgi:hypothetical protein